MKGFIISVKVVPKASKNEVVAWENSEWRIRVAAVPEKGKANTELMRFLAKTLEVSRSQLKLVGGESSRHKRILCSGLAEETINERLANACRHS